MFEEFGIWGVVIEYLIIFLLMIIINYVFFIRKHTKLNKKKVPIELNYLITLYKINVKKINYKRFVWIYNLINAFIISTIYIIIVYLLDNIVIQLIVGTVLLVLLIIICYGLLGRYYQKKEGIKDV